MRIESEKDMAIPAAHLAGRLRRGDVVVLRGGLGAGKTAFARALINHLAAVPEEVPSPTFTLVQTYELPAISVFHFDLYRLEEEEGDILELGWDDARREGVSLVEWPERLGSLLPADRLEIEISFVEGSDNAREVAFLPFGAWVGRI